MDYRIKDHVFTQIGIVLMTTGVVLIGGFGLSSVYAQADTSILNFRAPFASSAVHICGGQEIIFSGDAHFIFKQNTTPNGKLLTLTHLNYQNMKGIDVVSGDNYQVQEINNFVVNQDEAAGVFHTIIEIRLINSGPEPNSLVTIELHTVIDPDGVPKLTVSHVGNNCDTT